MNKFVSNIELKRMVHLDLFSVDEYLFDNDDRKWKGNFDELFDTYLSEVNLLIRRGKNNTQIDKIIKLALNHISDNF